MPVKCALFENNITADPDDDAEGDRGGSPKVQDIVDHGPTANKPDILPVTATLKPAYQQRVEQRQFE